MSFVRRSRRGEQDWLPPNGRSSELASHFQSLFSQEIQEH